MIDAALLLQDLKRLLRSLETDLRDVHGESDANRALQAEWQAARDAGRTGQTLADFRDDALTQAAVHWILGCVFLRFLEDNGLVERPWLAGPGERMHLARDHHDAFSGPTLTIRTSSTCSPASTRRRRCRAWPACSTGVTTRSSACRSRAMAPWRCSPSSRTWTPTPAGSSTTSPTRTGARGFSATSTRTCPRRRASAMPSSRRPSSSRSSSWSGRSPLRSASSATARSG